MATVKLILYDYYQKKGEDKVPLYIRITHQRKTKYISLGIKVHPEKDWDEERLRVKSSFPESVRLNNYIGEQISFAEKFALDLATKAKVLPPYRIREEFKEKPTECFIKFAQLQIKRLDESGKVRTSIRYNTIVNKLKRYLKGKSFTFDQFTVPFLFDYEIYLKSLGNETNTIHTDLKTLRAILYTAINEDKFPQEKNPFFRFKLKRAPVKKERLTIKEIEALAAVPLNKDTNIYHTKNVFLFSFYCAGIRVGDLVQLKWENVAEVLNYQMGKTRQFRRLKLVKQAVEILDLYRTPIVKHDEYIFPFLKNDQDYSDTRYLMKQVSSKTTIINKNLRILSGKAGITKKVSSHIARHSFADIARKKGIKLYDISKALGHSSLSITEQYLSNFDDDSLDDAMDEMFG